MMPNVNYVIYDCSSARTTPGVSLYQSCLTLEKNIAAVYYSRQDDRWQFEKQIKNQTLCTYRLFLQT